jgi:hypothetical protein
MKELAVNELAIDPRDAHIVYASSFHHGLYRSTDGGQSWSQVGGGLPADKSITIVRIDPHDSSTIYAGRNQAGLYRSTDGGQTWRQLAAGLPAEGVITDVAFDPQDPQVLYAAEVFSGVYRSVNGGKSWNTLNEGLLARSINALAISNDGLHLYAASEGSGVYRLDLNGQPPEPVAAPVIQAQSTATAYPYQSPTPASGGSKGSTPSLPCGIGAIVPLAFVGAILHRRPRPPRADRTLPARSR